MPRRTQASARRGPEEMREHLLDVAMKTFERHGIEKTVMDDIAKAAAVSRPTVYRYLGDRTQVLLALVQQRADLVIADTHRVVAKHVRVEDKLVEGMVHAVERARKDPFLGVLVSPHHLDVANAIVVSTKMSIELNVRLWLDVLEEGQRTGEVRPELDLRATCEWLSLVEFIFVGRADRAPHRANALRVLIRTFVLPALLADQRG